MYKTFGEGDNIRFTQSKDGKTQYIFLFNFPEDKLMLTKISLGKNAKLQLLGSKKKIDWEKTSDGVKIKIPSSEKAVTDYVWVLRVTE
jgi:alpha-L-fucosidase